MNGFNMKRLSYHQQLNHPQWQRKRLEVMKRDNFTCLRCRSTENKLTVHHSYYDYRFMLWDHPDHTLKTLCEVCHLPVQDAQLAIYEGLSRMPISEIMQLAARIKFTSTQCKPAEVLTLPRTDPVFESKRQKVIAQLEALSHG